jgi:hypothetical protein
MHSHLIPSPSPEGEGSKFSLPAGKGRGEVKSKPRIPMMLILLSQPTYATMHNPFSGSGGQS